MANRTITTSISSTTTRANLMISLIGLLFFGGAFVVQASSLAARSNDEHVINPSTRGDTELNRENKASVAPAETSHPASSGLLRSRRWILAPHNEAALAAAITQQQQQQQQQQLVRRDIDPESSQARLSTWIEDEQALRRQLPELIAQAYNDKQMERALLKMLINASTKSALSQLALQPTSGSNNVAIPSAAAASSLPRSTSLLSHKVLPGFGEGIWPTAENGNNNKGIATSDENARFLDPARLASLEQSLGGDYASVDGGSYGAGDALSQVYEKREHVKPCLFNAISCPKYPFSKVVVNKGYR